jgi:hypothetical protein
MNLLMEKPMTTNVHEAKEIFNVSTELYYVVSKLVSPTLCSTLKIITTVAARVAS